MPIISVRCYVLGASVPAVADFEGFVTSIICPHYEASTHLCHLKEEAQSSGPLSQLVQRVEENTLDRRGTRCDLL
jgi:hypothetical protein